MRLYLASVYSSGVNLTGDWTKKVAPAELKHRQDLKYILESYHYVHSQPLVDKMREDGIRVFLDSGAFSAYFGNVEIDLEAYCDYIHRNHDIIEVASVLDGIGDPLKTYENQAAMEALGTRPLPCFHYGEDPEFLKFYVANYDHITLGGMVPISTPQLKLWLDEIWSKYLTKPDGSAKIKVHGFGMTAVPLMKIYPWYSVDSSSWVQISSFGNIILPENGSIVTLSSESPNVKQKGKHFTNIPQMQQDALRARIEDMGFSPDRMSTDYHCRRMWNIYAYQQMQDEINMKDTRFINQQTTLF